jgi:hypothetical protein
MFDRALCLPQNIVPPSPSSVPKTRCLSLRWHKDRHFHCVYFFEGGAHSIAICPDETLVGDATDREAARKELDEARID